LTYESGLEIQELRDCDPQITQITQKEMKDNNRQGSSGIVKGSDEVEKKGPQLNNPKELNGVNISWGKGVEGLNEIEGFRDLGINGFRNFEIAN
jgi:hypothetical protein